ncbi:MULTISPECIES: hypothetical protein [Pelosinus]|uniref:Uncharacterized protein n=1 Tax=Pelosinus fermentans B4 TaxID=1149862 RepID=I8RFA6_9FIRM|nr:MULTISPECIES: hypothetical protein [Pelosinus]EIW18183.1 hypothetical protein FB4_3657 [Pelosinus fermentans B4]EIW23987.1 hypothetical protein FA11_3658 [Pelosinus fermentans A11]OAM94085.1 hypothetical protein FR7_02103 [Pelosinus fermentans DSM 17108]SDQ99357.1 hypothetical protein SAMN04515679_2195 [Pelosinus fermentans]
MFSNLFIVVLVIIFLIVFVLYKRQMLLNLFSLTVASSATQFQEQIEETADVVIQRLEEKIRCLEDILLAADVKIAGLDKKIMMAEKLLDEEIKDDHLFRKLSNFSEKKKEENIEIFSHQLNPIQEPIDKNDKVIDNDKEIMRNHKRSSVLALAEQGYSSVEIAKTTGISKSEIILLLQLHKK